MKKEAQGFTLIELIVTMVLLSIISVATSNFIVNGFSFYVDATQVQKISTQANFVTQKVEKLIRRAVPISFSEIDYSSGKNELSFYTFKTIVDQKYAYDPDSLTNSLLNTKYYGLKSPYIDFKIDDNQTKISYLNDSNERKISKIKKCAGSLDSDNYYCFQQSTGEDPINFVSQGRIYIIDQCVTLKLDGTKLVLETQNNCTGDWTTSEIADNLANFKVRSIPLSYNHIGELELEYEFNYPDESLGTKKLYQRVGVTNAP